MDSALIHPLLQLQSPVVAVVPSSAENQWPGGKLVNLVQCLVQPTLNCYALMDLVPLLTETTSTSVLRTLTSVRMVPVKT